MTGRDEVNQRPRMGGVQLLLMIAIMTSPAYGQVAISASTDVSLELAASGVATDHDILTDDQMGLVALESLGVLPAAAEISAFEADAGGDFLLAFASTTELPGGIIARTGDVVRFDGFSYSVEWDAAAAGLPAGSVTDGLSVSTSGLILSFDTTVELAPGFAVSDEDLVEWDGAGYSLAFDGSAQGVDPSLDLDAAHAVGENTFLVSFDTSGILAGIPFADEDVLRFDGIQWSLEYDASAVNPAWGAADLDAVSFVPEPGLLELLGAGLLALAFLSPRRGPSIDASKLP